MAKVSACSLLLDSEDNPQTKLLELETKMETVADVFNYQLMKKSGRITFICGTNHRYQKV